MKEPKIENPISFILEDTKASYYYNGMYRPRNFSYQTYYRNKFYGFIIIMNGRKVEYPTHGMIRSAGFSANFLYIFEIGKSISWKFDKNGELVRTAQFSNIDLDDKTYLETQYGISPDCNLEEANNLLRRCLKQR